MPLSLPLSSSDCPFVSSFWQISASPRQLLIRLQATLAETHEHLLVLQVLNVIQPDFTIFRTSYGVAAMLSGKAMCTITLFSSSLLHPYRIGSTTGGSGSIVVYHTMACKRTFFHILLVGFVCWKQILCRRVCFSSYRCFCVPENNTVFSHRFLLESVAITYGKCSFLYYIIYTWVYFFTQWKLLATLKLFYNCHFTQPMIWSNTVKIVPLSTGTLVIHCTWKI